VFLSTLEPPEGAFCFFFTNFPCGEEDYAIRVPSFFEKKKSRKEFLRIVEKQCVIWENPVN